MLRSVLAVAAVLAACGVGLGQATDPEREKQLAGERKKNQEAWEKYLKKNPTEVSDVVGDLSTPPPELPKIEAGKEDSKLVKAAKLAMGAERRLIDQIGERMKAGSFAGNEFGIITTASANLYSTAQLVWDEPAKLLPFAEFHLRKCADTESFLIPRVEYGVEAPYELPRAQAARYKAEIQVLQLREKVKKK